MLILSILLGSVKGSPRPPRLLRLLGQLVLLGQLGQ